MRLLYYDKYLDQLIKMPKQVQKSALDFAKKFKANPASAAIHLEPISSFRDPSLRSARVTQKYRAIVQVEEEKELYALIWIDNHDEAYRWAENKIVSWNEETLSLQVYTDPKTIPAKEEDKTEKEVSNLYTSHSDKNLIKIGVPEILLPAIRGIKDLDGLEKMEKFIPESVFENLFLLADGASIENLMNEVAEGRVSTLGAEDKYASINNQRNFLELFDEDEVFQSILEGDFQKWRFYLHPSQRKIVEYDSSGPIKVSGGAGTGKTVAAMHRLKQLTTRLGKGNIVFLTYTKALRDNLIDQAAQLSIPREKYEITHIDNKLREICQKYKIISDDFKIAGFAGGISEQDIWEEFFASNVIQYSLEFLRDEYEQVLLYNDVRDRNDYFRVSRIGRGRAISRRQRAEIWKVIQEYESFLSDKKQIHRSALFNLATRYLNEQEVWPFDACIVDELQDLSNIELRFVRALVPETPNDLFLVGDPMQRIYDRRLNFTRAGINIRGKRSRRLRINYRTTEEIRKRAIGVIKDIPFDDFDGNEESKKEYLSLYHGQVPSICVFNSVDKEMEAILGLIAKYCTNDSGYLEGLNQLVIACRTKNALKEIKSVLHQSALPSFDMVTKTGDRDGVHLCTFHSLKGLEYRHVILADVNNRTCPLKPYGFESWEKERQVAHLHAERSLIYVAMTRAVFSVDVVGVGEASGLI